MAVSGSPPGPGAALHQHGRRVAIAIAIVFCACTAGPIDIATPAPIPPPPNPLLNGLLAHWPLDEGVGTVATDRSGHGYDGTISGGTWVASPGARFGSALHFDLGSGITVPSFPPATTGWSVALWVRPATVDFVPQFVTLLSTEIIFMAATATTPARQGGGWQMNLSTPTSGATVYQFGYWLGPSIGDYFVADCRCALSDQWTHVAGVVDVMKGTLSFFVNGDFQSFGAYAAGDPTNQPIKQGTSTLYIGRWETPGSRLFVGELDDIVIYNRILTSDEVKKLSQAPAPDPP